MTFSQISEGLDVFRKYGMDIMHALITAVVSLAIIGTIIMSILNPGDGPEPPLMFPDHPRSDDTGCTRIDGLEICPRAVSSMESSTAPTVSGAQSSAGTTYAAGGLLNPYGEKRRAATIEMEKSVGMVSHVLQIEKKIDLHAATFEDGPAAYARGLGWKHEIVFDFEFFEKMSNENKINWPLIGLAAHESGHVIFGGTIFDNGWENEASAEYFAGLAIYRLGGDLKDALSYSTVFSGEDDKHPPHNIRIVLMEAGWRQAKARHENPYDTCKSGLIGEDFQYKKRVCKAAVSCGNEKRPIKIACQDGNGKWSWQ